MKKALSVLLALVLVLTSSAGLSSQARASSDDPICYVDVTAAMNPYADIIAELNVLNSYRLQKGLNPLTLDVRLTEAAMQRAAEIAICYDGTHTRPNGQKWSTVPGIHGRSTGENIASGFGSVPEVMDAWKNSPGHNANMLGEDYKSVGLGHFYTADGGEYWTQEFSSDEGETFNNKNMTLTYTVEILHSKLTVAYGFGTGKQLYPGQETRLTAYVHNSGSGRNTPVPISKVEDLTPNVAASSLNADGTATVRCLGAGDAQFKVWIGSNSVFTAEARACSFTADSFIVNTDPEVYNGNYRWKTVTPTPESGITAYDYHPEFINNRDAGTATIRITGQGHYSGTIEFTFEILKADRTLNPRLSNNLSVHGGRYALLMTGDNAPHGDSVYRMTTSNANVVRVDNEGNLTAVAPGYATITIEALETKNYKAGTATLDVMVTEWSFDDKPSVQTPPPAQCPDVLSAYADAVDWATCRGYITPKSTSEFGCEDPCPRWEVVDILWRAMGCPEPKSNRNPFSDVSSTAPYYKAVIWAVGEDITNGTTPTTFSPNDTVERCDAMTFIWRAAKYPYASTNASPFRDVTDPSLYYYEPILWAVGEGITNGEAPDLFGTHNPVQRGQMVTFLYRQLSA